MKKGIILVFIFNFSCSEFVFIKKVLDFACNLFPLSYIDCVFLYFIHFHMKKISILSLLWLAGLLSFVATPTFAQEVEEDANVEEAAVVADVADAEEDVVADAEEDVVADTEISDEEVSASEAEDIFKDHPEAVEELNAIGDEILNELELTDDERAEIEASFETPEDRAFAVAGLWAIIAGAGIAYLVCALICLIIWVIALWVIFNKAWEKGWKAIIPFYNVYIWFKIVGMKNWFWYMLIIAFVLGIAAGILPKYEDIISPLASLICGIIGLVATFKLPRKFGWGVFTSILFVLFTLICMLVLAFGSSKYQGKIED